MILSPTIFSLDVISLLAYFFDMKAKVIEYPKIISPDGKASAVLIPIKEWNHVQTELRTLKKKLNEMQGIRSALEQIHSSRNGKKKMQTLKSFLNER